MSKTATKTPRERLKAVLNVDNFDTVALIVDDLPNADAVYRVLLAARQEQGIERITPAWCKRRDDALKKLDEAVGALIASLRVVDPDYADEYSQRLRAAIEDAISKFPLLSMSVEAPHRPKGGRPANHVRRGADRRLSALGVSVHLRRELYAAMGLTAERR